MYIKNSDATLHSSQEKVKIKSKEAILLQCDTFFLEFLSEKEEEEAEQLIKDAKMLEKVGCFGIVLEKIPAKLAKQVAESVSIPIIGIGAGPDVDGQVLLLTP